MKSRNRFIATIICITAIGIHSIYHNSIKGRTNDEVPVVSTNSISCNIVEVEKGDEESLVVVKQEKEPISINTIVSENTISENKSDVVSSELLQFPQLSDEDIYYLKKIATCEARYDRENMAMTMLVVLNRVKSPKFPNTIYEVIHQKMGGVYQFSVCRPGSTWYTTEPNEMSEEVFNELWDTLYDYSCGALYFNSYQDDKVAEESWFGTLEFLFKVNNVRYYK